MLNETPLCRLIHSQAERYGDRVALMYRDYDLGKWCDISWNEFSRKVRLVSNALIHLGVEVQEKVAVFSQNKPECLFCDYGAYGVRAVTIPFYATSSEQQVRYMVSDANVRYIFVGEQFQYDTALRVMQIEPHVKQLIIFDPKVKKNPQDQTSITFDEFLKLGEGYPYQDEVEKRSDELQPDDLANILYTSGTTGLSKGVMQTHRQYAAAFRGHVGVLPLTDKDVIMNFLPFTHIFERAWSYLCVGFGCTLAVNLRPQDVLQSMLEVHPTCMAAVPRFWEKVYAGVQEKIQNSSAVQRTLMLDALRVGKEYNVKYRMRMQEPPLGLKLKYKFYEKTIIALLLKNLGLERQNFFPTAGAAVPVEVEEFVHAAGIGMMVGYGLTESTATVSCDHVDEPTTLGSVGRLLPGVQVKIGENNEILLKGETITKGYFRKAEVTANAIDEEGWFHTGDAGYMKDGELFLTDRIKDLFKTSNGKYIAPQMIETKLVVDRYVDQCVLIADQHKFVSALIIPNYEVLEQWARDHKIEFKNRADLCQNAEVNRFVLDRIETMQQDLAHYEQVKRITLLPEPFSLEKGEITNTLKVKRPVVYENYKKEIEKMYEE